MEQQKLSPSTLFKNWAGTEFFNYNHLTGILVMVVNDGCLKGLYTRCDSKAANLSRQFHRGMEYGVPQESQLYYPLTAEEFHEQFAIVTDHLHYNSMQSLISL
jgi:hypothetical protein